jgi:2-polyprenyl-6-methoxyphenol hydroxylase-like FAD-dependent oxidoreductase
MGKRPAMKVIIAGGGISGLTLANALEQAGVDYVLLERRDKIDPNIGQSIASEPNGARILDQLGIMEAWKPHAQPCHDWYERDTKGKVLHRTDSLELTKARHGYYVEFGERVNYLRSIYNNLKDKSKVLVGKGVVSVEESDTEVTVRCEDGSSYTGDILVGADGVRSKIKEELWKIAENDEPEKVEHDKKALFAEYQCLFGVAKSTPEGPVAGDADYGYDVHRSSLVFAGPHGTSYFFIFEKLAQIVRGNEIPRFDHEDAVTFAKKHKDFVIRPGITLEQYWNESDNFSLVAIEEGTFDLWTHGRIALIGDASAKMTPNAGFGGNSGIESAAALANAIYEIKNDANGLKPSSLLIKEKLKGYQLVRAERVATIIKSAGEITRMQAIRSGFHRFMAWAARTYPGEFIADFLGTYFSASVKIDYLPPPKASLEGLQPFNPSQGFYTERKMTRLFFALPFLALFFVMLRLLDATPSFPWLFAKWTEGKVEWEGGYAPVLKEFYHIKSLDEM